MTRTFNTTVHGKWILVGEHAVIRGCPALVFPVPDRFVSLAFSPQKPKDKPFDVAFDGPYGEPLLLIFWGLIEESLKWVHRTHAALEGQVLLNNTIPMGSGLGFSAALCVAVGRWFCHLGWLDDHDLFAFARHCEDFFHSQSSGVDIAGTLYGQGVCYTRGRKPLLEPLNAVWQPMLYLSYVDVMSVTAHCVKAVEALWARAPNQAKAIDQQMHDAVILAKQALRSGAPQAFNQLAQAIESGCHCFYQWGLIKSEQQLHIQQLKQYGASAVKPTGAGHGGYVLSLWSQPPPPMPFTMIRVGLGHVQQKNRNRSRSHA